MTDPNRINYQVSLGIEWAPTLKAVLRPDGPDNVDIPHHQEHLSSMGVSGFQIPQAYTPYWRDLEQQRPEAAALVGSFSASFAPTLGEARERYGNRLLHPRREGTGWLDASRRFINNVGQRLTMPPATTRAIGELARMSVVMRNISPNPEQLYIRTGPEVFGEIKEREGLKVLMLPLILQLSPDISGLSRWIETGKLPEEFGNFGYSGVSVDIAHLTRDPAPHINPGGERLLAWQDWLPEIAKKGLIREIVLSKGTMMPRGRKPLAIMPQTEGEVTEVGRLIQQVVSEAPETHPLSIVANGLSREEVDAAKAYAAAAA